MFPNNVNDTCDPGQIELFVAAIFPGVVFDTNTGVEEVARLEQPDELFTIAR